MSGRRFGSVRSNVVAQQIASPAISVPAQKVETMNLKTDIVKVTPKPCETTIADAPCGYSTSRYENVVVREFSITFTNWEKYVYFLRRLATSCPAIGGPTFATPTGVIRVPNHPPVNVPALSLYVLCKGKWRVDFYPGRVFAQNGESLPSGVLVQQKYDIVNYTEFPPNSGIFISTGNPIPVDTIEITTDELDCLVDEDFSYSTQELTVVDTSAGVAGVYAQLYERLFDQDLEIQNTYTDESGFLLSLRVPPRQINKLRKILDVSTTELADVKCYDCPDLPKADCNDDCESAVLNCSWVYPCKCPKDCDDVCKPHSDDDHCDEDEDEHHYHKKSTKYESMSAKNAKQTKKSTYSAEDANLQCGCHKKD